MISASSPKRPAGGLQVLPVNTKGRDWVVGDIQGHLDVLNLSLQAVQFDPSRDRLIGVGDLVDRGPDSWGVLKLFHDSPWFFSTMGNHDAMVFHRLRGPRWHRVLQVANRNGATWVDSLDAAQKQVVLDALGGMPLAIELPLADGRRVGVIHAQLPYEDTFRWRDIEQLAGPSEEEAVNLESSLAQMLIWERVTFSVASFVASWPPDDKPRLIDRRAALPAIGRVQDLDLLVAGHSALEDGQPVQVANRLWIDSYIYGAGFLTLYDPLRNECVQRLPSGKVRVFAPAAANLAAWEIAEGEVENPEEKAGPMKVRRRYVN